MENSPPWALDMDIVKPVSPKTRNFADALFEKIVAGGYSYGTKLPAERTLSEEYDLSRNTVRQALELLDHYGVTMRQSGRGSVVCYRAATEGSPARETPSGETDQLDLTEIAEITSPLELGVVRSIIEPEIARLAVLSMSSREIKRLCNIQEEIEKISVDGEELSRLDDELRMLIAEGTHNPLLITTYSMVNHVNRNADWAARRRKQLSPARIKDYKLHNRSLCQAIKDRDIEAAVEYLKLSLAEFHQDLMRGV